jgi:hypothetical protein
VYRNSRRREKARIGLGKERYVFIKHIVGIGSLIATLVLNADCDEIQ